jgi:hypothetical protein
MTTRARMRTPCAYLLLGAYAPGACVRARGSGVRVRACVCLRAMFGAALVCAGTAAQARVAVAPDTRPWVYPLWPAVQELIPAAAFLVVFVSKVPALSPPLFHL